jgi:hypothetical protein
MAFFVADKGRFTATEFTRGPWSPDHQHGGPPAGLLARAIEHSAPGMHVARLTVEFLRPIPLALFTLRTEILRPGKRVQLLAASLQSGTEEVCRATALCLATGSLALPEPPLPGPAPLSPEASEPYSFTFFRWPVGYHTAVDIRRAAGVWGSGAMTAWMRMRVPLVEGEVPSPLVRVVVAADAGNGVSAPLDPARWTFINPDLTVYLHRPLVGEWVCLDGWTTPEPIGIGLAQAALWDERGVVGRSLQSLLIAERK